MPQHTEQSQLVERLGAGWRGEHQQRLRLVLGQQHLAVDLDLAELWVHEHFVVLEPVRDLVPFPELGELGALARKHAHQFAGA